MNRQPRVVLMQGVDECGYRQLNIKRQKIVKFKVTVSFYSQICSRGVPKHQRQQVELRCKKLGNKETMHMPFDAKLPRNQV
jgi:hypothetical protein